MVYLQDPEVNYRCSLTHGSFIYSFKINFKISVLLKWTIFFRFCYQNVTGIFHDPCASCRFSPTFHRGIDHSNNIWWAYATNKLLITELFHFSYFICLGSRNSLQDSLNTFKQFQALNHRNEIWQCTIPLGFPNWLSTCYRLDVSGFEPRCRQELFTSPQPSTATLGPTWPPVQWVMRVFPKCKGAWSWCWPTTPVSCRGWEWALLHLFCPC